MRRTLPAVAAVLVVVATVAVVPAAGTQVNSAPSESALAQQERGNETENGSQVAPGERLAGVVGVQQAEVDGEVESRSFGLSVARAANDNARAALIAAEVNETGDEVRDLQAQRERLQRARENGSMSEGEYSARVAELAARSANAERMATESANASKGLPEDVLRANGVNVTAIQTLQQQADELGRQAVASVARSIAGDVGGGLGEGPERATERSEGPEQGDRDGTVTDRPDDGPDSGGDTPVTSGNRTVDDTTTTDGDERGGSASNSGGR